MGAVDGQSPHRVHEARNGRASVAIRSRVPLRVSFAGGGTDVPPYPQTHGGVVLCAAIDRFAFASLAPTADGTPFIAESLDYGIRAAYAHPSHLAFDGELDLLKASLRRLAPDAVGGAHLSIHSDAPPGSGLGSSSAMTVAIVGALSRWLDQPLTDYEVAHLAVVIEREDLAIEGGLQDQYACTFGGFNFIEFHHDAVVVNPLRVNPETLLELQYTLLLVFTGTTRRSDGILARQIQNYGVPGGAVQDALQELKHITLDMKRALLQSRLDNFGALLHAGWENKKRLATGITTPHIDEMYACALRAGAIGGKVLGAGGGGYLLLACPETRRHAVARACEQLGGTPAPFQFEATGLRTWRADGGAR